MIAIKRNEVVTEGYKVVTPQEIYKTLMSFGKKNLNDTQLELHTWALANKNNDQAIAFIHDSPSGGEILLCQIDGSFSFDKVVSQEKQSQPQEVAEQFGD